MTNTNLEINISFKINQCILKLGVLRLKLLGECFKSFFSYHKKLELQFSLSIYILGCEIKHSSRKEVCSVDFFHRPHVIKPLNVENKKNLEFVECSIYIFTKEQKFSEWLETLKRGNKTL